ncbi:hypothetical protein GPLA_1725 [Paraglaciecola polaris LMG 21857]|uniref:Uncharacterized protein n=1 Tax=Paraglaciecola polaris LMG 21857 TaxID=1129793 RepID=K7AB81_9ALTE|nr:hypothetical protein GPLA_1725 [Paraglaciecola polaris LMG 21857]
MHIFWNKHQLTPFSFYRCKVSDNFQYRILCFRFPFVLAALAMGKQSSRC